MIEFLMGNFEKVREHYERKTSGKHFEFELTPPAGTNGTFNEINRFRWESKQLTRFKNQYEGHVLIDLTAWNDNNCLCDEFDAFMYYLKDNPGYLCTFTSEKQAGHELIKNLDEIFGEIKQISFITDKPATQKRTIGFTADENKEEPNVRE